LQFIKQQRIHFVNKHARVTNILAEKQQMVLELCAIVYQNQTQIILFYPDLVGRHDFGFVKHLHRPRSGLHIFKQEKSNFTFHSKDFQQDKYGFVDEAGWTKHSILVG
jgi:hypothetical protein